VKRILSQKRDSIREMKFKVKRILSQKRDSIREIKLFL